jgi:hypothetical protein
MFWFPYTQGSSTNISQTLTSCPRNQSFQETFYQWYIEHQCPLVPLLTPLLSRESMDSELRSNARATDRLFLISLVLEVVSLGEPWGVDIGVAAVWVIIGGLRGPGGPPPWLSNDVFMLSSLVTETDGGSPSSIFSASREKHDCKKSVIDLDWIIAKFV